MSVIGRKIDMIVCTDVEGNMRPIRFRLETSDGSRVVINVKRSMVKNIRDFRGHKTIRFICQSIINNTLVNYEVTYETRTMRWLLYANQL
ncbi:MAG: hypothetical protein ACOX1R_02300 [Caldicoprobacterales bacterium]|jgi:hypothetical protein